MLAYAPRSAARSGSPRTLILVAVGHVVALALVLTARSEFVVKPRIDPTDVIFIKPIKPPPPIVAWPSAYFTWRLAPSP